mmetsp:Transcript_176114/g.559587  ORF Transcript_176114/g.559587 Transcript_176114/m.559587 type:complete len:250 (-) Transcript_176114:705-1454(-)
MQGLLQLNFRHQPSQRARHGIATSNECQTQRPQITKSSARYERSHQGRSTSNLTGSLLLLFNALGTQAPKMPTPSHAQPIRESVSLETSQTVAPTPAQNSIAEAPTSAKSCLRLASAALTRHILAPTRLPTSGANRPAPTLAHSKAIWASFQHALDTPPQIAPTHNARAHCRLLALPSKSSPPVYRSEIRKPPAAPKAAAWRDSAKIFEPTSKRRSRPPHDVKSSNSCRAMGSLCTPPKSMHAETPSPA